ncbi:MAG TPA: 30S ribosomal protein S4e [Candidatus Nanoarchaeia archaeon]|nr:30S ribosomal protein S4e [Candidatus Nanoarchaeia archaeon]
MAHLKSLAAPNTWPIARKKWVFVTKPNPGPHTEEYSMPLIVILRDILKIAHTTQEVKKIVAAGKVMVNGIPRKEMKYPVGILDTLGIPDISLQCRMLFNPQGKFAFKKVPKEQASARYVKIRDKTTLKGKRTQLNFLDGTNMFVEKDVYKVGDTLVLHNSKVKEHLKFEKGAWVYLIAGKHIGKKGKLEEIHSFKGSQPDRIVLKRGDEAIDTLRSYAFVVDEGFEYE